MFGPIQNIPLYLINQNVSIRPDTTPGVSNRISYRKEGRIQAVIHNGLEYLYEVTILLERSIELVSEAWIDPSGNESYLLHDESIRGDEIYRKKRRRQTCKELSDKLSESNLEIKNLNIELNNKEKMIELYKHQSNTFCEDITALKTFDFSFTGQNANTSSNKLVQHMQGVIRYVYCVALRKIRFYQGNEIDISCLQDDIETLETEVNDQLNEIEALIKSNSLLSEENNSIKSKNKRLNKDIESIQSDNLFMEFEREDERDDDKYCKTNREFSVGFRLFILRLFRSGQSIDNCEKNLQEMFEEFGVKNFDIPSEPYLQRLRRDLAPLCDVIVAMKMSDATYWRQLGHDGSSIFGKDTTSVSMVIENKDSTIETILLSASYLAEDKSSDTVSNSIDELIQRKKKTYEMFLNYANENKLNMNEFPSIDNIKISKLAKGSIISDNNNGALSISKLLANLVLNEVRVENPNW